MFKKALFSPVFVKNCNRDSNRVESIVWGKSKRFLFLVLNNFVSFHDIILHMFLSTYRASVLFLRRSSLQRLRLNATAQSHVLLPGVIK